MLADIDSVFDLLSPLFTPPTKPYVTSFAAESFAYLIRKHPDPGELLNLLERKISGDGALVGPIAMLLFETVKGVQYKFNTHAEVYLNLILQRSTSSKLFQNVYLEILGLVVIKITKTETQLIWDSLYRGLSSDDCSNEFLIFSLACFDVLLKGGRHTYLTSSSDLLSAITPLFKLLDEENFLLEEKLSGTIENFIRAHNQLMKYLKQMVSSDDVFILSLYLDSHKSVKCLHALISVLCDTPEFYNKYCPVILNKIQNFDLRTYIDILAEVSIHSEAKEILDIARIFAPCKLEFKQSIVKFTTDSWEDETLAFQSLKVIQCFETVDDNSISSLTELLKTVQRAKSSECLYLELVKCVTLLSEDKNLGLFQWSDIVTLLSEQTDNVIVLQTVFYYLRHCGAEFINESCFHSLLDLLKVSLRVIFCALSNLPPFSRNESVS
jgi:hypothetical protein